MLLELCDYPLKEWLSRLSSRISVDNLENMLTFTLNIAQGVAHLHSNKVIPIKEVRVSSYPRNASLLAQAP